MCPQLDANGIHHKTCEEVRVSCRACACCCHACWCVCVISPCGGACARVVFLYQCTICLNACLRLRISCACAQLRALCGASCQVHEILKPTTRALARGRRRRHATQTARRRLARGIGRCSGERARRNDRCTRTRVTHRAQPRVHTPANTRKCTERHAHALTLTRTETTNTHTDTHRHTHTNARKHTRTHAGPTPAHHRRTRGMARRRASRPPRRTPCPPRTRPAAAGR